MREINIEEFWSKRYPHGKLPKYAKEIALEFAKEVLELAAENAEMNNITFDSEERFSLNGKRIILDAINQIK